MSVAPEGGAFPALPGTQVEIDYGPLEGKADPDAVGKFELTKEDDGEAEGGGAEGDGLEEQMVQIPSLLKIIAEENEANECWCGVLFWFINAAFYVLVLDMQVRAPLRAKIPCAALLLPCTPRELAMLGHGAKPSLLRAQFRITDSFEVSQALKNSVASVRPNGRRRPFRK